MAEVARETRVELLLENSIREVVALFLELVLLSNLCGIVLAAGEIVSIAARPPLSQPAAIIHHSADRTQLRPSICIQTLVAACSALRSIDMLADWRLHLHDFFFAGISVAICGNINRAIKRDPQDGWPAISLHSRRLPFMVVHGVHLSPLRGGIQEVSSEFSDLKWERSFCYSLLPHSCDATNTLTDTTIGREWEAPSFKCFAKGIVSRVAVHIAATVGTNDF